MPRRTTAAEGTAATTASAAPVAMQVVIVTMDSHLAGAAARANRRLATSLPGVTLTVHAAAEWGEDAAALARCIADIGQADIVIATMLFMEDHFRPVLPALAARRDACDAMVCGMSAGEVMKLTRMGRFAMDGEPGGPLGLLRRLRKKPQASEEPGARAAAGAQQMRMLRRLPKILRFLPGTAQDVRAYFLTLQYWLAGSEDNVAHLVEFLVDRYADGPRRVLRGRVKVKAPIEYPEVGLYHPRMQPRLATALADLPRVATSGTRGTVGLLLMRSYLLAGNTGHYDGVIAALEARGLRVIPAFATGLDARPAVDAYFLHEGRACVDAVISLTGFSLVGGPAYNDARAAEALLAKLDVPYLAVTPVEFETLAEWEASERGLLPVETTMMVALPELDGAIAPMVFGGRSEQAPVERARDMQAHTERADALSARVARLVDLRRSERAERKVGVVLFNFPPNSGAAGTAAFLSVFESLHNVLAAMQRAGYTVDMPASVDELRAKVLEGNASRHGSDANVHARISANEHVKRERHLKEIEAQWGPAPGRQQSDGAGIFVLGAQFGNVFVGLQPAFGYEGDPMRLLFERGFAPTHAFSAFYRWLREDFGAHAVLHFGTHGALEFMPGKQVGLSASCWPERLIGDLPNVYLYASNNPSEGTLAKRRAAATLVSYLTPPVAEAGLVRQLADLKATLARWRSLEPAQAVERAELAPLMQAQAAALDLAPLEPAWPDAEAEATRLQAALFELETTLIPHGLHVVGRVPTPAARADLLRAVHAAREGGVALEAAAIEALIAQPQATLSAAAKDAPRLEALQALAAADRALCGSHELDGLLHALDGGYIRPAPGGDLLRTPEVLPTGRNLHGFDPFRVPSAHALMQGARQAERLLERHRADGHAFPESIAMVLWGSDNLKSDGEPIGQALALMGAAPRFDSYGRLAGAQLLPLAGLGRPRVDVVLTLSGIFRDLLPLQIKLLAEAALLAAQADEPESLNFIRKHALAYQRAHGGHIETAALRVFGNAEGAYGANVNHLVDNSRWDDADELAETYTRRKGYAYGVKGRPVRDPALLQSVLAGVELAYQNLDSVELGVTTVDTYFDTLGGISRAVSRAKRRSNDGAATAEAPVYIGDATRGDAQGTVRTLAEQVALETRTRMLNPVWYEELLAHGSEGVRHIEAHVTHTLGWSATTGQVQPWVYQRLSETFVLDPQMRERLAKLNPRSSARMASRLLEASQRQFWKPDSQVLDALRQASDELEDRLEGVYEGAPA